jgi:hypothetical protein
MIFCENGKSYNNVVEYYLDEKITLCFGEPKPLDYEFFDEAFDITIANQKNNKVNVYVRNHTEGRGSDINHAASVKVRAVDDKGKEFGPEVPYIIPNDKYEECVIVDKHNKYSRFDSKYGEMVRAFVNHSKDGLNEYWEADTKDLDQIETKIRSKYNRHVKNKNKK